MKRPQFADQHPVWFVFILEIVIVFVYLLSGTVAAVMKLSNLVLYGVANAVLAVFAIAIVSYLGWWKEIGFRLFKRPADWLFFLIPFFPILVYLAPGVNLVSIKHLAAVFIIMLSVGFVEEVFFRGLMLKSLKNAGPWSAILVTSVLFGLTRALNPLTGKNVLDAVLQTFNAIAIGITFAALVIKKGVIWPLIIAHFLADFIYFLQPTRVNFSPALSVIILAGVIVIFSGYGIWLMFQPVKEIIVLNESLT